MRILVIEDHALVREGMLAALGVLGEAEGAPAEVVGAADADEAVRMLEEDDEFDLATLDLMLPGTSGMTFLGVLRRRFPHIPVVVVSALDDGETVAKAVRQGAAGYVSKGSQTAVLLEALRQVLAGETWLPDSYSPPPPRRRGDAAERFGLTRAQRLVLELIAEGRTNREIAVQLGLAEGTVKIHVTAILKALGVGNRSQALLVAQGKR